MNQISDESIHEALTNGVAKAQSIVDSSYELFAKDLRDHIKRAKGSSGTMTFGIIITVHADEETGMITPKVGPKWSRPNIAPAAKDAEQVVQTEADGIGQTDLGLEGGKAPADQE